MRSPAAWLEARLRRSWVRPHGGIAGFGEVLFGSTVELRHLLYDAGVVIPVVAPLPIISIGGLTVGGSGKTPITSQVAGWLAGAAHRVAVLTRGFPDEMAVHRELNPAVLVFGHPSRCVAARTAARAGAEIALLDDGFQHRRLRRDLEIVLVDIEALASASRRYLPAGPFRERFGRLARADILVIVQRTGDAVRSVPLARWLVSRFRAIPVVRCRIRPGPLAPANRAASLLGRAEPAVALAGIMKPRLFFRQLRQRVPGIEWELPLRDHQAPSERQLDLCVARAGGRGIVCTLKDVVKLRARIPEETPLWYVPERVVWDEGEELLRARIRALVPRRRGLGDACGRNGV